MESVLDSVKKMIGYEPEYRVFDADIMVHINSALLILYREGSGNAIQTVHDKGVTWEELFGDDIRIEMIKDYLYSKVKLSFDPPTGALLDALKNHIAELEFSLSVL